ncbi:MBL fold metallo-hydrolase [Microbacterium sp. X-17]|uniref:MBL fold metallo-hydrolase n=1 Tax=Microbacterium sp. X-17 TaxID=3144404 RepID=UPI0031F51421
MSITTRLRDVTIHQLHEFTAPYMPVREMLPALSDEVLEENRSWLGESLDGDDQVMLVYQSYIVRTPRGIVLVDTGVGNDKPRDRPEWHRRTRGQYLAELRSVGVEPRDVDYVVCTHFHPDHVGWNTVLRDGEWVPTFPNATYVFTESELAEARAKSDSADGFPPFTDSILPVLEAGRARVVTGEHEIDEYVRIVPSTGHTAGHGVIAAGRDEDLAVLTGDLLHVELQLRYPDLSFVRDLDQDQSARARRTVLERYCDTDTLICTGHLPRPSMGHLRRWGDSGYELVGLTPAAYTESSR